MTAKKATQSPVLTIMVPVYNEENTLKEILERVCSLSIDNYEVIVIDDASKDKSPKIIRAFAKNFKNSNVLLRTECHTKNSGKGSAIQTALKLAAGKYFVIQDADLEYYPEDLVKILKEAIDNDYEVIYGSRFLGKIVGMPKPNYMANKFYNALLRLLYKTSITDMHTCYKMLKTELFQEMNIRSNGFGYATELISKLLRRGYVIHEAPIRFNGRTKKEGKKIDVGDGIECIVNLVSYRFSNKILSDVKKN